MEDLTLLEYYKNTDSKIKGFVNIFNYINNKYIKTGKNLNEKIINELIELGDYCFDNNEKDLNLCKEQVMIYNIYKDIKKTYAEYKKFEENSLEILCSLNYNEVREVETLSNLLLSNIYNELNLNLNLFFKNGFSYQKVFEIKEFNDNENVLKLKSYIANILKNNGVIFIDFFGRIDEKIFSSSIIFTDGKWYPLSKKYTKKQNKLYNLYKKNVNIFELERKEI